MIEIAVINASTAISNAEVQAMLPAFSMQWNRDLAPSWGIDQVNFQFLPGGMVLPKTWWLVFLDNSDQANALAYHDLTNEGLPLSKVFVKTLIADKASVSVGATHELCEMGVDPHLNSAYQDSIGTFWAGECCDPCEADQYGYLIDGVLVSDFVTPAWYAPKTSQGPIDFMGHCTAAFSVLTGGYAQKFDPQSGWVQITGALAAASNSQAKAQPGSRRERRTRQATWQVSNVVKA